MTEYSTPGQLIDNLLGQRGWSQKTLALVIEKSESTINKIISGKSSVTCRIALALEDVFGVNAEQFLELQQKYDLAIARISIRPDKSRETRAALFGDLPIKAMIDRGWIFAKSPQDLKEVEAGLVAFFGVSSADEIKILPHAAKKT